VDNPGHERGLARPDTARDGHLNRRHGVLPVEPVRLDVGAEVEQELALPRLRAGRAGQLTFVPGPHGFDVAQRVVVAGGQELVEFHFEGLRVFEAAAH
jgi:hypothetical protein